MDEMQVESQSELTPPPLPPPPLPPSTVLSMSTPSVVPTTNGVKEEVKAEEGAFSGKVIQITNVSPGATLQQIATLFGFLGTVTDIRMYPTEENPQIKVRLCYIKFESTEQCGVAQHLTNTVFIDKPIIVVPLNREEIPEENECRHLLSTINAYAATSSTGILPQFFPQNTTVGLPGLPPPPIITTTTDPGEIEEIKRTIFVENISHDLTSEQLMAFFSGVGEVKYLRFVKDGEGGKRYAFIEFTNLSSVPTALQYNGVLFGGKCLKVKYSKNPIIKPESERIASGKNPVRKAQRDAVKRPSSVEPVRPRVFTSRSRSPSPSRFSRRRSRSRDRRHRRSSSRTRSPRRRRSRSRSRSRRRSPKRRSPRKSRSPRRSRSRSTGKSSRKRSKSKSKSPVRRRRRSRSRDKRRRKRSGSRSVSRSPRRRKKKSKSRSKSRSTSPKKKSSRRSPSRSPDRSSKKKKKDKDRDRDKDKDKEKKKEKDKDKNKEKEKEKHKDDEKSDEKELKNLLNKIKTFEEKKEKKADE